MRSNSGEKLHHVFDDHHVLHAAEAELAVDRVRQVMRQEVLVEHVAADRAVALAAATGDHDDAVAGAAVRGLERELGVIAHDVRQLRMSCCVSITPYSSGTAMPACERQALGLELVVDQRIQPARD